MPTAVLSVSDVLQSIQRWNHWTEIQQGAEKEYGIIREEFDQTLPEYQKFLALVAIGHRHLGMFSEAVDKIWHAHILFAFSFKYTPRIQYLFKGFPNPTTVLGTWLASPPFPLLVGCQASVEQVSHLWLSLVDMLSYPC